MLPVLQIGPLALQTPGLLILIGIWIGISLVEKSSLHKEFTGVDHTNLIFIFLITVLIGARLAFVIKFPSAFFPRILSVFAIDLHLFDWISGVLIGLLIIFLYAVKKKINLPALTDLLTPFFACGIIFIHLANAASGKIFGAPTSLPWGIWLWGEYRHPVQLISAVLQTVILAGVILFPAKYRTFFEQYPGLLSLFFISSTAFISILTEALRGDSFPILGVYRLNQIIAFFVLAVSLFVINQYLSRKNI